MKNRFAAKMLGAAAATSLIAAFAILMPASALAVPPVGAPDTYSTVENTVLTVAAPGVLANDSGPGANLAGPSACGLVLVGAGIALMGLARRRRRPTAR